MKIAACFLYILLNIAYLTFGDSSMLWGGIYLNAHILFIAYLSYEMQSKSIGKEQLFFQYITGLSIAHALYTGLCVWKDKYWVIYNTNIFSYILAIGFLVFLLHCALKET